MTPIACRFDFPDQIPASPLSAEVRRNTFLILKEAINNVVKHSGATSVELSCKISDHQVEFSMRDDGRGFTSEHRYQHGNGLRNMRKRSEEINGNLQIESQAGHRTHIRPRFGPWQALALQADLGTELWIGLIAQRFFGAINGEAPLDAAALTQGGRANIGYGVLGPLFVAFSEWVQARACAEGTERLYFLAREGH